MKDTGPSRRITLGWALALIWPVAAIPLLMAPRFLDGTIVSTLLMLPLALILIVAGIFVVIDLLFRLFGHTRANNKDPAYPCPTCGADVEHTPHRCQSCGARLVWGNEPGPRDVRSYRGQWLKR